MPYSDLIRQMTLTEKALLLTGKNLWETQAIPRLGVPAVVMSDGSYGLRREMPGQEKAQAALPPRHLLPRGRGAGQQLGCAAHAARGRGAGRGGRRPGRGHTARPGHERQAHAPVRPQL